MPTEEMANPVAFPYHILKTLIKDPSNRKYLNNFQPLWSEVDSDTFSSVALFLIARENVVMTDGTSMYDYTSIEEEKVIIDFETAAGGVSLFSISYGPKEAEKLFSLYANTAPQLQVTLDEDPLRTTAIITNSVKGDGLTFNSLSSLGPISQETLALSVTSDSEGTVIEQREAVVTDVGGLYATGERENTFTLAQEEAAMLLGLRDGPGPSTVIITSGY